MHRITGNCLSILYSNGTIKKCQKSKILQEMHLKSLDYSKYIAIADMGLLSRLSTLSSAIRGKDDGSVSTWKDYGNKVFETILRRHPSASMIMDGNNYYGNDLVNVKGGERQKTLCCLCRWSDEKCILCEEKTFSRYKRIQQFFFQNPLNKIRLEVFLKTHFSLRCRQIIRGHFV